MPKATHNGPSNAGAGLEQRMSLADYLAPGVTEEVAYEPGTEPDAQAPAPPPRRGRKKG